MAPRVLVTRPAEDAASLTDLLRARGYEVVYEPLLSIRFLGPIIDLADVQAVLITSANGARALAMATPVRMIPVFTVGDASSRTCRELGFGQVMRAGGDVADLTRLVTACLRPENGVLLHTAGNVTAGDLGGRLRQAGFLVRKVNLYVADTVTALGSTTARMIADGAIEAALFYSPRTATTFATLVGKAEVSRGLTASRAYCLSEAVRRNLTGLPWQSLRVATAPDQESLLAAFDRDHASSADDRGCPTTQGKRDMTTLQTPHKSKGGAEDSLVSPTTDVPGALVAPPPDRNRSGIESERIPPEPKFDSSSAERTQDNNKDRQQENPTIETVTSVQTIAPLGTNAEGVQEQHRDRGIIVAILLVAIVWIAGFASIPWWRDHVPEPYRSYLPTGPAESSRWAELERTLVTLRRDLDALTSQLDKHQKNHTILEQQLQRLEKPATELPLIEDIGVSPLKAVSQRLEALETTIATLTLTEPLVVPAHQAAAFESRLSSLSDRLDSIAREQVGATTLASIYDRLAALEEITHRATARQDTALAWLLAVVQLREAVHRGAPFVAELHATQILAEDATVVDTAASGFITYATTGLPTRSAIEARFDSLNGEIARAAIAPEGNSWLEHTLQRLLGLVTIHRTDDTAAGDSTMAIMARASAALHSGDLAEAVRTMDSLQGAPARVAVPWMAFARARTAADEALSRLTAHALKRTAVSHVKTGG